MGTMARATGSSTLRNMRRKGNNTTNKVLTVIAVLGLLYTAAIFLEVTSATGKSYKEQLLQDRQRKMGMSDTRSAPITQTKSPTPTPTQQRITNSHLVTWILTSRINGKDKDINTQHSAHSRLKDSPPVSLTFAPGSLQLSHAETLKYCYTDPSVYSQHFQGHRGDGSNVPVSYSEKYKLAYVMLPKSGSSTARHMLKDHFDAKETQKSLQRLDFVPGGKMEGVEAMTFVRDPLSRFFSQYEEAYVRTAPWVSQKPHPFPYLFENINSYEDYENVFCPPEKRKNPKDRRECEQKPTAENGTLATRLERFVREYDGRTPFDVHLTLQVPMLSAGFGVPLHMTQIYNTSDADNAWRHIAKQFLGPNSTILQKGAIEGRSYPRRLNNKLVSVEAQRRICELALLDYCCLNLPLPEVCQGAHYKDVNGGTTELMCKLGARAGPGNGRIQPGILPNKVT